MVRNSSSLFFFWCDSKLRKSRSWFDFWWIFQLVYSYLCINIYLVLIISPLNLFTKRCKSVYLCQRVQHLFLMKGEKEDKTCIPVYRSRHSTSQKWDPPRGHISGIQDPTLEPPSPRSFRGTTYWNIIVLSWGWTAWRLISLNMLCECGHSCDFICLEIYHHRGVAFLPPRVSKTYPTLPLLSVVSCPRRRHLRASWRSD